MRSLQLRYVGLASMCLALLAASDGCDLGGGGAPLSTADAGATPGTAGTFGTAGASVGTAGASVGTAGGSVGTAGAVGTAGDFGTAGVLGSEGWPIMDAAVSGVAGATGLDAGMSAAAGFVGFDAGVGVDSASVADGRCLRNAFPRNGVCSCQAFTPFPCATACVDPLTDPDNCGGCGIQCGFTATCIAGRCGPSPTTAVASAPGCGSLSLAASNGTLVWADQGHGTVMRAATGAATITGTLVSNAEKAPRSVVIRSGSVFWLSSVDAPVATDVGAGFGASTSTIRLATGGGVFDVISVTALKASAGDTAIHGFTVSADGVTVYYSTANTVRKVATTGGAATDVAVEDHNGIPKALALQDNLLAYPTDFNGDVDIVMLGGPVAHCGKPNAADPEILDNVACNRVARSQGSLNMSTMIASGADLFWIDGANIKSNPLNLTAPQDNLTIVPLDNLVRDMTLSNGKLFFVHYDDAAPTEGYVEKTPTTQNSTPTPLARRQAAPTSVAVDGKKVFWSTSGCDIQTTPTGE